MCPSRSSQRRPAMTLIELLVVITIILVIAGLAAAFMPRVQDSTRLSSSVDQLQQWLLTAKMRAKRDGLATGIRLIQDANDPGMYSQFKYIQQPDPLSGGTPLGNGSFINGGYCTQQTAGTTVGTTVLFPAPYSDFSLGGLPQVDTAGQQQWLVQVGDYLELRDGGGIHLITAVQPNSLTLSPAQVTAVTVPWVTSNYRILRQPRALLGENPLQMPGNFAVDLSLSHIQANVTGTAYDILFSPSGTVVGTNAGLGKVFLYVHDLTENPVDPARSGVVAVQTLTGFIGSYNAGPAGNPYLYANEVRGSGF